MAELPRFGADADFLLHDRLRGFPAGHAPIAAGRLGELGLKPFDGAMQLPLISLDLTAFDANAALMLRYVQEQGVAIAPHAKTPMSPALARRLVEAGAWGTTVADIRQASVMLASGLTRLIIANEIGGHASAKRLAAVLAGHAAAEIFIFADTPELVEALAAAWAEHSDLPRLGILAELGLARGGARTLEAATAVADAALARESPRFRLAGVAAYEGAAVTPDPAETRERIGRLMAMTGDLLAAVRARVGTERPLVVTAGGSVYFDLVVKALQPAIAGDGRATLVLRSGAIFFHDHGVYDRGLKGLDARGGFVLDGQPVAAAAVFRPALRLWAEVLSRPEPGLAVCGMGHRDVAIDQGYPRPLALYRDGRRISDLAGATVSKLNDQHAFLDAAENLGIEVGDVVEFGISHPCTCLDRHAVVYGLDETQTATTAFPTSFG
ncbi:MAG: alanine racemase [Ancalomicrobiaceae bacterium]|nr:alanine racemase [Ancalomicrobiaceae bacterium]